MNLSTISHLLPQLKHIHSQRLNSGFLGGHLAGQRSKVNRLHAEALMRAGLTRAEAWSEINEASALAERIADEEHFMKGIGVTA